MKKPTHIAHILRTIATRTVTTVAVAYKSSKPVIIRVRHLNKKQLLVAGIVVAGSAWATYNMSGHRQQAVAGTGDITNPKSPVDPKALKGPEYKTILPGGKDINDFGGWTRVSPSDKNPVFAYVDRLGDIPINVSQQPIPSGWEEDVEEQVTTLAHDFNARDIINVGDLTAYAGVSAKGPQSLIFVKNDVLVLIKASARVEDQKWRDYISSLK